MEKRVDKMMPDNSQRTPLNADTFWDFVEGVNPTLLDFEHVPRLVGAAERVVAGDIRRLMVLMPPRYFKSTTFSRLLPAYFLSKHPEQNVGLASYSARLAWSLSDDARQYYREAGYETAPDTDAKREWETPESGKMWADGLGGSLTGSGYHLGVIDDPMKPEHARSRAYIEAFREWYPGTWYNRAEPGARQIVVMQRLSQQDPIDFLFRREVGEETEEAPQGWHVLCMDEIKSSDRLSSYSGEQGLPPTCTLMEDPRSDGQILAPSRFDEEEVEDHQRSEGKKANAQRQQRPKAPSGDFWREEWFLKFGDPSNVPVEDLPEDAKMLGKDWDCAYTADESNSASAYLESAYTEDGEEKEHIWITSCDWAWMEFPDLLAWMKRLDGPHHIEDKASGKSVAQALQRDEIPAQEVEVQGGDKYARAVDVQPIVGGEYGPTGRVHVHASVYDKLLRGDRQGLLRIDAQDLAEDAPDLDLNDVFVQALQRHTQGSRKSAFQSVRDAN